MNCLNCNAELPDQARFCLECGSSVSGASKQSSIELSIGDMRTVGGRPVGVDEAGSLSSEVLFERYDLVEEIGRGGFAVVHRAVDKKLSRTVAIKRLHAGHDALTLERFKREARVIAGLNHRNIVGVYDVGEDREGTFLVMEYIEGGSLREHLKANGALGLDEALKLMSGILQGLAYAHRRNLVHRDIKPTNILLQQTDGECIPKIVDFGLAQAGRDSELSMTGYGMGSPYYMPPEQRRDAKSVNHTADIYAMGKVLYELVSGEIPDTLDPSSIPSDELALIIFKCTKPQPHDRYFSVDELLQALGKIETTKDTKHTKSSNRQSKIGNENACPACGVGNPDDVKFCVKCGSGLTYVCGECGREENAHNRYCGGCGTDIPGFKESSEILARMDTFMREQKWSRVQKEFSLFDASVRLPGEKGFGLKEKMEDLSGRALRLEEKHKNLQEAVDREEYDSAFKLVVECLDLDPDNKLLQNQKMELCSKVEISAGTGKTLDLGDGITMELVWIPPTTSEQWKKISGGKDSFLMGSPKDEKERDRDELQHEVKLTKGFWLGKYPVTQAQYEKVMGENPSYFLRVEKIGFLKRIKDSLPDHPVECVPWGKAEEFCKRVGNLLEEDCRLPTEAQWEYACRARSISSGQAGTKYCFGEDESKLKDYAWYCSNSGNKPHAFGRKQANAWGLCDMHGNVWEWCSDWYGKYSSDSMVDPVGARRGSARVKRGGSWFFGASYCRSARRACYVPSHAGYDLGFRLLVL